MRAVLAVALLLALAAGGWLFLDNQRLRGQLEAARHDARTTPGAASDRGEADAPAPPSRAAAPAGAQRLRGALGRLRSPPTNTTEVPATPPETWAERRARRQARIEGMFGRAEDETEEEYRARMVPLVEGVLDPQ